MADERDWKHFAKMSNEAQKPALQQADVSGSASRKSNRLLAAVLSKLDEMTEQSEESAKIFEQHQMVASQLTSEAMAQAYKNVKQWILNGC
jgi:hypothetical protein